MARQPKYTAKVISSNYVVLNNFSGELCRPTFDQSSLAFFNQTGEYSSFEVCKCLGTVTGNTQKELSDNCHALVDSLCVIGTNISLFITSPKKK